jgi:RNA polymerase sigma factor (sigma-70 family)
VLTTEEHHETRPAPITNDEALALSGRIRTGDREAEEELVLRSWALLHGVMRRIGVPPRFWEDIKAEGQLMLVQCARGFDPDQGAAWSTYVYWAGRRSLRRELLRWRFGRALDCRPKVIEIGQQDDGWLEYHGGWDADALIRCQDRLDAHTLLGGLACPRDRLVLEKLFLQDKPLNHGQIGALLGVSQERARQIHSRALRRIQKSLIEV